MGNYYIVTMTNGINKGHLVTAHQQFLEEMLLDTQQSLSFAREYEGKYGHGIGNIFPYDLVEAIIEPYGLILQEGSKVLAVDPAYGSSKFGILGCEQRDGIIYVMECMQYERPSPSAMLEIIKIIGQKYKIVLVDSAHPGLVLDLNQLGIQAIPVVFQKELSEMTITAAQTVREKKCRIHPTFHDLINQLKAVRLNEKGHPDKKELSFDLGDCFLMACNYFRRGVFGGRMLKTSF